MRKPRRYKTDSPEVTILFDLYDLLNTNGQGWIKGKMFGRRNKRMCYCLVGGVNKLTGGGDNYSVSQVRQERHLNVLQKLAEALPRAKKGVPYPRNEIMGFNDDPKTEWPDVKRVIFSAIQMSRR